ncbi:2OG-Fe(II) oxygenase [Aquimarina algicola]|uniref:Prolyl 4-hydroxylase subunit alpha n=1 Tax=Aquimarina algicola TaxID=2589995 RepID=A0A504J8C0_9FLAO|nr:2OG-Fe(II) oxygenase [Aquimarina algicola]TPN86824.1 prolyl 4-hydroxylase subunit alpha [Aquimarina algicola]
MENLKIRLTRIKWQAVRESMNQKGYATIPKILSDQQCNEFIKKYDNENLYRKTVVMERYRFGLGEYKYFDDPLPEIIQILREMIYPKLSVIANLWMRVLNIDRIFPETLENLQSLCHQNNQSKPTPLILKYGKGGFNTLHQDLYGEVYFPMQCVLFLNEPDKDFTGGEFVLTQQTPRAQSKATVLKPRKGDMLIFTTNFRPVKGIRGYYRVNMKHGVSEVISGERHTLGVIFHEATN